MTTQSPVTPPATWNENTAIWLPTAGFYIGTAEIVGPKHNPRIQKWLADCGLAADVSDETAWCSAFANGVMVEAGFRGTNKANARSWLQWGRPLAAFRFGALYVFSRKDPANPNAGHVFFALALDTPRKQVIGIGGNQRNEVCIDARPLDDVLGIRWPTPKDYVTALARAVP